MPFWGEPELSDERIPVPMILIPKIIKTKSPQKETILSGSLKSSPFPQVSCQFMRNRLGLQKCEKIVDKSPEILEIDEKSANDVLAHSIKILAKAQGFDEIQKSTIDIISDLTKEFLKNFGETAKIQVEKAARRRKTPFKDKDFTDILNKTLQKTGIVEENGVDGLYEWYRKEVSESEERPGSPVFNKDDDALWDELNAEQSIYRMMDEPKRKRKSKKKESNKKTSKVEVEDEFSAELNSPLVGDLGQGDSLAAIVNAALVSEENDDFKRVDALLSAHSEESLDCLPSYF
ncbi:unnamed protein product [Oikopleura dioica]|uniref:Bromodomain associated domain-containing protein n=1 Tax=Oikopleura dioica TaxID=34765 RepID=E4YU70_OIKDI|nr:unnamed protein product [Oikopleura dioica]